MNVTAFDLAERFIGMDEVPGSHSNPQILAMLHLDAKWPEGDEVPWCSAFVNYIAWLLRLPRSKSLRARSWLEVGRPVRADARGYLAEVGFDIVILKRGTGDQPGPGVINAPGHVGFFAGFDPGGMGVLGGNQSNQVSLRTYPEKLILGLRRLREDV